MSRTGVYDLTHGFIPDDDTAPEHPQTNADRIRAMSDEELARFITDDLCELFCGAPSVCDGNCEGKMLSWLKSPVEKVDE